VDGDVCRPTGRGRRRSAGVESLRHEPQAQWEARDRAVVRSGRATRSTAVATVANRSNTEAVFRRRRVVGAVLLGAVLAGTVWVLAIIGGSYQDAATPDVPAVTQVVHVRSGESLTDVARRIAPDLPAAGVVAQLRAMNGLETSGLRVSQSLVAPAY
jgi:hypothetical protein